jgi:hypothetical protein
VSEDALPYAKVQFMHEVACKQLIEVEARREEGMQKGILTQE